MGGKRCLARCALGDKLPAPLAELVIDYLQGSRETHWERYEL